MSKRPQLRKGTPTSGKRQKFSQPFSLKQTKEFDDDEISSDEDLEMEEANVSETSSDNERVESLEEKRHRLAKAYLSQIDQLEDEESDNHEEVANQLKINRLKSSGKYYHTFSDNFIDVDWRNVTQYHLNGHQGAITCVSLTADEKTIFSGSKDNSVFKWDIETGSRSLIRSKWNKETGNPSSHQDEILTTAVTSDGRYLAVAGRSSKIYIHDHRLRFSEVKCFEGHRGCVTSLAFQYDTYSLFSASSDRCIKYWDLNEMAYIETLFGHQVRIEINSIFYIMI
jgi:ribosomal RNA-processing protein 9